MAEAPTSSTPPWLRSGADRTIGAPAPGAPSAAPAAPAMKADDGAVAVAEAPAAAPAKKKKSKLLAVVHMEGCTGCDVCVEFCPVDCIYHIPGPEHILAANPHAA